MRKERIAPNTPLPESAFEQIACCKYCAQISDQPSRTPVQCTKYAGSSIPISVNLAACFTCGEYKLI